MYLVCRLLLVPPAVSSLFPYTTLFRSTFVVGGVVSPEVRVQNGTAADITVLTNVVATTDNRQPIAIDERSLLNGGAHSRPFDPGRVVPADRKSTRLNSSHRCISYAVFCLFHLLSLLSFPTRRSSDLPSWWAASSALKFGCRMAPPPTSPCSPTLWRRPITGSRSPSTSVRS